MKHNPCALGSVLWMQGGMSQPVSLASRAESLEKSQVMEWPGGRPGPLVKLPDINLAEFYCDTQVL